MAILAHDQTCASRRASRPRFTADRLVRGLWSRATNFADHLLECPISSPATDWSAVTNAGATIGDRLSVTLDTASSNRFYRLRKP